MARNRTAAALVAILALTMGLVLTSTEYSAHAAAVDSQASTDLGNACSSPDQLADSYYLGGDGARYDEPGPGRGRVLIWKNPADASDLIKEIVPPSDLDPMTATNQVLTTFGLPARPTDPLGLANFQAVWGTVKGYEGGGGFCTSSMSFAKTGDAPNPIWAGPIDYNNTDYRRISANFYQPDFALGTLPGCRVNDSNQAEWVGLGGYNGTSLLQMGTSTTLNDEDSAFAWFEAISTNPSYDTHAKVFYNADGTPWLITKGHKYNIDVYYQPPGWDASATHGRVTFRIVDLTTNIAYHPVIRDDDSNGMDGRPVSQFYGGNTAEAITERGSSAGTPYGLRQVSGGFVNWGTGLAYRAGKPAAAIGSYAYVDAIMKNGSKTLAGIAGGDMVSTTTWQNHVLACT